MRKNILVLSISFLLLTQLTTLTLADSGNTYANWELLKNPLSILPRTEFDFTQMSMEEVQQYWGLAENHGDDWGNGAKMILTSEGLKVYSTAYRGGALIYTKFKIPPHIVYQGLVVEAIIKINSGLKRFQPFPQVVHPYNPDNGASILEGENNGYSFSIVKLYGGYTDGLKNAGMYYFDPPDSTNWVFNDMGFHPNDGVTYCTKTIYYPDRIVMEFYQSDCQTLINSMTYSVPSEYVGSYFNYYPGNVITEYPEDKTDLRVVIGVANDYDTNGIYVKKVKLYINGASLVNQNKAIYHILKQPDFIELMNGETESITYLEYSHSLTVYNPNDYDLSDYQVKIIITEADVGNQFFWVKEGSIRLYDSNGVELPYWVESWDSYNKEAVIWTKVPNIPAGGSVQLTLKSSIAFDNEGDGELVLNLYADEEPIAIFGDSLQEYTHTLTVYNPNSYDLVNYQVKIVITGADVGEQFYWSRRGSIRLYDQNGVELPYWVEEWDAENKKAVIWTKVSIPAGGTVKLTLKSSLTYADNSDGKTVFEFFDDFETWEGWVKYGSGTVSQSSAYVKEGSYSLKKSSNGDPNGGYKEIGKTLGRNIVLEAWVLRASNVGGKSDRVGLIDDSGNGYGFKKVDADNELSVEKRTGYSSTEYSTITSTTSNENWYFVQLIITDTQVISQLVDNDGVLRQSVLNDSQYTSFTRVYVFGGYPYYVDDLRIRKYADEEPIVVFGESFPEYTHTLTIYNPNNYDLSDYQVKIVITGADVGSQFYWNNRGSIRLYDSNGVELPYWVEEWDAENRKAVIWTKVSIPAGGSVQLTLKSYLFYDDKSNGEAVFEFFDDFEGTVLDTSKWYLIGSGVSVSNGVLRITQSTSGVISKTFTMSDGVVESKWRFSSGGRGDTRLRITVTDTSTYSQNKGYDINYRRPDGDERLRKRTSSVIVLDSASYTYTADTWYVAQIIAVGTTIKGRATEDAPLLQVTDTSHSSGAVGIGSAKLNNPGSDYVEYDWVRVRKYADQEPTVTFVS